MKVFNIDGAAPVLRLMTSYRKLDIASEKEINCRVTSLSNQSCQISIIVEERKTCNFGDNFFLFLRQDQLLIRNVLH